MLRHCPYAEEEDQSFRTFPMSDLFFSLFLGCLSIGRNEAKKTSDLKNFGPVTHVLYNAGLYIIRVRLCINHANLAIFSDILRFFYTISLSITRIIYKIRLYILCVTDRNGRNNNEGNNELFPFRQGKYPEVEGK